MHHLSHPLAATFLELFYKYHDGQLANMHIIFGRGNHSKSEDKGKMRELVEHFLDQRQLDFEINHETKGGSLFVTGQKGILPNPERKDNELFSGSESSTPSTTPLIRRKQAQPLVTKKVKTESTKENAIQSPKPLLGMYPPPFLEAVNQSLSFRK